jgi:hypothetical protein
MADPQTTDAPADGGVAPPRDYSDRAYRFYLELADCREHVRRKIEAFLPEAHAARVVECAHGFELEMPIQCAPDLVRHLAGQNIAIYQLVRLAET